MASLLLSFTSCESSDNEFPDFDYQTVYFANQYALRTIELGEDEFVDNSIDNEHKFSINAAWGGGYTNRKMSLLTMWLMSRFVIICISRVQIFRLLLCRLLITR